MDQERGLQQAGLAISNRTPISTTMPLSDVWLILSALQMTITHPGLHEPLKQAMERIGRDLEARIVEVLPEVAELAAAGWDRSQDYIDAGYEFDDMDSEYDIDFDDDDDELDDDFDDDDDDGHPSYLDESEIPY